MTVKKQNPSDACPFPALFLRHRQLKGDVEEFQVSRCLATHYYFREDTRASVAIF